MTMLGILEAVFIARRDGKQIDRLISEKVARNRQFGKKIVL